jgi:hypothetical protein
LTKYYELTRSLQFIANKSIFSLSFVKGDVFISAGLAGAAGLKRLTDMPFTQQQLTDMFSTGAEHVGRVAELRRSGGDPAAYMNDLFGAPVVIGVYRKKRGGIGYLVVRGVAHLQRILERGQAEHLPVAYYLFESAEAATFAADVYDRHPDARWVEAHLDGRAFGLGLTWTE